ncbi:MAG: sodium-dependent transporter [Clostridia bacterium]|nr:sodium-dependent transporter [Clostridia bacterium]
MEREKLGSRLGFILLSAGCAIGCGNVWKFPWMAGQYGGGAFVLIYLICLLILGLPVMVMEFSLGRASQASPIGIHHKLQKPGQKWHWHGKLALAANFLLMMFYTSVTGWMLYYFVKFIKGDMTGLTPEVCADRFGNMLASPAVMVGFMAIVVVLGFLILSFGLQKGVESVTKYMMLALLCLMLILAANSFTLDGAKEGLSFYLKPDLSKLNGSVIVAAMNQAFFTLSLGIGSMAIFGSYIGKDRTLMGESLNILGLDTFVALVAGLIIFPACFTYDIEVGAGPNLLFESMATVFNHMEGGRWWGSLFFLFMFFAAMSTIIAVFENILAMLREITGWSRVKGCIIAGILVFVLSVPCALGFNLWSEFSPFASGSGVLDLEDFLVSNCCLPLGSFLYVLFCVSKKGWGFDNFLEEANSGKGPKLPRLLKPYLTYVVPTLIAGLFLYGILSFKFADDFTILGWIKNLF